MGGSTKGAGGSRPDERLDRARASAAAAPAVVSSEYRHLLESIKERVRSARVRAAVSVNRELVLLYWEIGRDILTRQAEQGWGAKVIEELSRDLRRAFPDMTGLSSRNLKYMRAFAAAWPDRAIVQQLVALIPWGHNVRILDKVRDREARLFYIRQSIESGWSRSVLELQIEGDLYHRQGKAIGLLLCKSRDRMVVEYALSDTGKPMGVAGWTLTRDLPDRLAESLPTVEMLEDELRAASERER